MSCSVTQPSRTGRPDPDYSLDAGPDGLTIHPSTGLIEWTPSGQQEGRHVVLIRATNAYGFDQEAFDIVVDDPTAVRALPEEANFFLHEHYPESPAHRGLGSVNGPGNEPKRSSSIPDRLHYAGRRNQEDNKATAWHRTVQH